MPIIAGGLVIVLLGLGACWYWLFTKHPAKNNQPEEDSLLAKKIDIEQSKSNIILAAIDDGVVVIDSQNVIKLLNPAGERMLESIHDEAVGLDHRNVLKLVDSKNAAYDDSKNPFIRSFREAKNIHDNNAALVTRSNQRLPISISVSPLLDDRGSTAGVVGIFRDVHAEREEERQRAEFISTASHEMRTPVAAIEGYLALAMNDKVSNIDAKAREYLEKAHDSTKRLGKLFQDLLTSAKAEDGRLSSQPAVVELGQYMEQLSEDLRFAAEKKNLSLEFVTGAGNTVDARDTNSKVVQPLYYVHVDPDRLREVINNVFDNAVKYTESGKISIGLTGNNEVVQFYIRDTGPGIPAQDIPHLFQKFYRTNNSLTRISGGTGLGLFISRKIIELYGGRIWIESRVDKGTTVFINLPRLSGEKAAELQASESKHNLSSLPPIIPSA